MEPMDAAQPIDFQPLCDCGALGGHSSGQDCGCRAALAAEVSGSRAACLEAVGILRARYSVTLRSQWQDPQTAEWVFRLGLSAGEPSRAVGPVPPLLSPDASVLAVLDDQPGQEVHREIVFILTGLEDGILSHVLDFLVGNGTIERVRPDVYRKSR
ncbi:hypothetical protein [Streptomyces omiyaensis]|uniref:Uncharacterized protein n=1 Tax=Streptomyces omiyaensis TaxID=68247 RepID=A0ABW7BZI2_9ACTN|nr:hypothetical protein [Streptomyces omiyaensis]